MKPSNHSKPSGFTLIELTVAMMMGMMIGAMLLALFNQQLVFLDLYKKQDFLSTEAPIISTYVSKLVGKADSFRLHDSLDDAKAAINPRLTASPVVKLYFRQPDGKMRKSILSFEERGGESALYYYVVPVTGVLGDPEWAITNKAQNVVFRMEQGVLRMSITGPENELIIYSGIMQSGAITQ